MAKTLPCTEQSISKGPGAAHRVGGLNLGLTEEHRLGHVRRRLNAAEPTLSGNVQKMCAQTAGRGLTFIRSVVLWI